MSEQHGDRELLARARAGDQESFRVLVERYQRSVASTVIGMLGSGDEADDVGQETFIRFYHAMDQFRGEASLKTYLQRIAINLSLNALKRRRRFALRFISRDHDAESIPEPSVDQDEALDRQEERRLVRAALARLGPKHRPVVVLRMIEGYSTRETAQMLGLAEGTVLSRLSRALKQLQASLGPYVRPGDAASESER